MGVSNFDKRTIRGIHRLGGRFMKRWGVLTIVILAGILYYGGQLGSEEIFREYDLNQIIKHAEVLSAQEMEGRGTGSRGNADAVSYIEKELKGILAETLGTQAEIQVETFYSPVQRYESEPYLRYPSTDGSGKSIDLEYGKDFSVVNRPRSGNIDYSGDLLMVSDSIYDIDPELFKGKIVITQLNRVTDDLIDDLRSEVRLAF